ncbi:alpha/beta fold hydrolase [Streptomyces alboniger]|uniref:Alpha/beta fold hydrolase n=1 Tax=Streptomyces alboniger TaxID=132473 RepID=A0A5J6HSB4_STRAD|nr:alpha/beta fold hydrolase [Streptomyces alboniger]QEV21180.1 alpha/beta fold hydrolase [Streptomyces alboniger]
MRNHDTKNTEVHVTASGPPDAPALVLIHGLAGSTAWWDPVVPALARAHRVLRVDLPGHGRSARPPRGDDDIPAQARRVAGALDGIGVDRAAVAGHSTGGLVGTALAEQRPDLVGALALINTGPSPDAHLPQPFPARLVTVPVLGRWMWRVRNDAAIRRALDTKSLAYLDRRELTARLAQLTVPLMVIVGTHDRRRQPSSAERYREVPGLRLELLPGVGHTPMLESPLRTADLLLAFTSSLR